MSKITSLNDLEIYTKSIDLCLEVMQLCKEKELVKDYWLVDQLKRASSSVAVNIAEGYGRFTQKDFAYFLSIALGSCNELTAFFDILLKQEVQTDKVTKLKEEYVLLSKRMHMFRKSVYGREKKAIGSGSTAQTS